MTCCGDKASDSDSDSDLDVIKLNRKSVICKKWKFPWILLPVFGVFWLVLFYVGVVRFADKLPTALTIATEPLNQGEFIAERAQILLNEFEAIGPKVVGSNANEVVTVEFLLNQIRVINLGLNTDLFKLEIDVQEVSGAYIHWEMVNMYQGIQNVVVKLTPLASTSESYLLINSHFDSKPGSPGASDPGAMVVVMLEVLRVMATGDKSFTHPIVFLINGAEENPLQGSHGFATQHKWAANCKVLINLDSAGSGHREIVFQSSANNPWLMKYYKQAAAHPYANTLAEELFQMNIIPSDTDFRNFHTYGDLVGLDIAYTKNGYVYHTEHDKANIIPVETLQNTGDNILGLARAFADAPELEDPSKYSSGSAVFYDLFGRYLILYTGTQAKYINYGVSILALLAVLLNIILISSHSNVSLIGVGFRFILTIIAHLIGVALAIAIPILLGVLLDMLGAEMSWFTFKFMVIGLYICPFIFGLGFPPALLVTLMKRDRLCLYYWTQLVLNSHCIVMVAITALLTYFNIKSGYLFMLATLIYAITSLFNSITTLYRRGIFWCFIVVGFHLISFVYFTYIGYIFFEALIPMMGRFGPSTNPELYMALLAIIIGILSLGFLIPLISLFHKPKTSLIVCLFIGLGFAIVAISPYCFPFREKTNVERFNVMHVRRVLHEIDNTVSKDESGYYFDLQDRRQFEDISTVFDTSKIVSMTEECNKTMYCNLPVFNHRWNRAKSLAKWLPSEDVILPGTPTLTLLSKTVDEDFLTVRYDFELDGPPHMGIYMGPLAGSNITDWTFLDTMLRNKWTPPYFVYFSKGKDQSTLKFFVTFDKTPESLNEPSFELAISGHYISNEYPRGAAEIAFLESFPQYTYVMEWPSSYEKWYF